ncbi:MAG: diaminopimelate dehydrogenase [Ruminococcaceae bacterium]|nr:diaminopimelate dehydrogenase [Oscillospiraceae bacterium]
MSNKIRIGIAGYGNLGRGVELAVTASDDLELVGIFTRRDPASIQPASGAKVYSYDDAENMADDIDVMVLCGGSATDLPVNGPQFAAKFNTVDSFDTHAQIPAYFANMDEVSRKAGKVAIISVGWDPGLFSLARAYFDSVLPNGDTYTFWGRGVSQGHSDAIRRIDGVKNAIQFTVPIEEAMDAARSGSRPQLTTRQKHLRECYVVAEEGADRAVIENTIKTMPAYFADYDTTVEFLGEEEFKSRFTTMPHGGFVIRSGVTGSANHVTEFSLKLDSNPQFTGSVLTAYTRAAYRLAQAGEKGARTVLDIAPAMISPKSGEQLRAELV